MRKGRMMRFARRGRGRSPRSLYLLCAVLCSFSTSHPRAATAAPELDLLGTWYVLVHYRDEATASPEAEQWDDRVWVFGKKGSRLSWTEYPLVGFEDQRGRFERTMSGAQSRVLAAWEPNAKQRAQIAEGLEVDSRGSKTKTLRGSASRGYKNVGGLRTQSVSVIGYHETWSIKGLPDKPVFARDDLMGSGRTQSMEGRTEYAGEEVLEGGTLIRGTYERDGTRHGVFRMMRAGELITAGGRKKKKDTSHKRPYLTVFAFQQDKREIATLANRGDAISDEELARLRSLLNKSIERTLSDHGIEGPDLVLRSESLASQVEALLVRDGKTIDEIDDMVSEGMIQP
jgi:hypothetical protein